MEVIGNQRSLLCSFLPSAIFLCSAVFFIGIADYKEIKILGYQIHATKVITKSELCENEYRPNGTENLPRGIVSTVTDLEMRPLWGPSKNKSSMNLLAVAVGIKQKQNVNEIVKKFPLTDFALMLFHYDGNVDGWKDLEWSNSAIHVSAINQTKWWFAKRFLHPDVVAHYNYIFLWDEDVGIENFHAGRYLSIIEEEGFQISQPALDPQNSFVHYTLTERKINSKVHRSTIDLLDRIFKCDENSTEPPCTGFVEMMAPVFSRKSWRCSWHMIQNDLIHAWGIDFKFRYCVQGDRAENIGIVDSEYIVHSGIPTLATDSAGQQIIQECAIQFESFKNRWSKAVTEDECWEDPFK